MKGKRKKEECIFERQPGSGIWYARWYDEAGKDKKKSVGSKTAAQAYLGKMKEEVRLRKLGLKLSTKDEEKLALTMADLLDRYSGDFESQKGARNAKKYAKVWKRELGSMRATDVTAHDILQWQRAQELAGMEAGTINRYTAHIRRVYNLAIRDFLLDVNPCSHGRVPLKKENGPRKRVLTLSEENLLLPELAPVDRAAFVLCLYSGMRQGEALGLQRTDIDFENRLATLPDTKAGVEQTVHLNEPALEALRFMLARHEHPFIFSNKRGTRPISGPRMTERLQEAAERVGLKEVLWHTTRHTFVTRLARGGNDIGVVKNLARHSTIVMTDAYMHTSHEAPRKAVDSLASGFTGMMGGEAETPPRRRGHLWAV